MLPVPRQAQANAKSTIRGKPKNRESCATPDVDTCYPPQAAGRAAAGESSPAQPAQPGSPPSMNKPKAIATEASAEPKSATETFS